MLAKIKNCGGFLVHITFVNYIGAEYGLAWDTLVLQDSQECVTRRLESNAIGRGLHD